METKYFECQCHTPEHTIHFTIDDDGEVYASVFLHQYRSFYHRLWIAVKYVFGYKCQFGHWDNTVFKSEDLTKLKEVVEEGIRRHNEKTESLQHGTTQKEGMRDLSEQE